MPIASTEAFAGIFGDAGLQLLAQGVVVEVPANDHQLVLAFPWPIAVVDGEALARKVEDVAALAFVEPKDPLGPEHAGG